MQSKPKHLNKLLPLSLSLFVLTATLIGLLSPVFTNVASAAPPSDKEIALYDAIRGGFNSENGSCNDPSFFADLSNDDAEKVIQGKKNAAEVDGDFLVSAKTDSELGDGNDESIRCQSVVNKSIIAIYGSYRKFLDTYYTNQGESANFSYKLKDCSGGSAINTDNARREACTKKLLEDMQKHASAISGGNQEWLINYGKDVLLNHFNRCWFWKSPDATSNEKRSAENEYDPSYWAQYDNNDTTDRGPKNTGNVGYLVEKTYTGSYKDGRMGCEEMQKAVFDNKLLSFSAEDDADSLTQQQKEDNLLGMFIAQGTDKLLACVAANNGSFAKIPMTQLMAIVADSISKDENQMYYPPVNGQPEGYTTAQQTSAIKSCLADAYGEAFTDAVDDIDIPTSAEEDQAKLDANAANSEPTCESEGGALGWILCKVLEFGDTVMGGLDSAVNNILEVPDAFITDPDIEKAFASMRNIAYTILVPMALVMVISTALGFEFISAYTIKRALPRMVIATIFIALSFNIVTFLVTATNNVGTGISGIIEGALGGGEVNLVTVFNPPAAGSAAANAGQVAGAGVGLVAIVTGGALGIMAIGSLGILLSYVLVALVALFMAFFLLSLRQALIVFLMIMAPVAILSWIFPGNDKLWKLWWSTFSKLLLLYPLIMILIATGKGFAQIAPGSGLVDTFIRVVAYFGPYFLIPSMFKFAGGAFATISGMANNRSKGLFDRNKKYRGRKAQENWRNTKTGNRFSERNAFTRGFNRAGMGVGAGAKGRFGIGERGRQAMDLKSQAAADEALKNNPELQKLAFNDDANAVMALSGGSKQGAERAARELFTDENGVYDEARAQRAIEGAAAVGFSRSNAQAAMTTLAQNKARSIATGERGRQQIQNGINRLAGGNAQMATNMRDSFAFHASGAGRGDLGATNWNQANAGLAGFERTDLYQAAHSQPHTIEAARDDAVALATSSDPAERQRAAVHLTELQSMLSSATGPSRDAIVESIDTLTPLLEPHMSASDAGPAGPAAPQTRREVFDSDRGSPGHARYDATYVAGWSAADIANGYRDTVVPGTAASNRERARQTARVYQGVDPHNLT